MRHPMYKQVAAKRQDCALNGAHMTAQHVQQGMSDVCRQNNNSNLESRCPTVNENSSNPGLAAHGYSLSYTCAQSAHHL